VSSENPALGSPMLTTHLSLYRVNNLPDEVRLISFFNSFFLTILIPVEKWEEVCLLSSVLYFYLSASYM
jgi:hypothetical protein